MKYHVITPLSRFANFPVLKEMLRSSEVQWHLLLDSISDLKVDFSEPWIHVHYHPKCEPFWEMWRQSINAFARSDSICDEDRYLVLNDDDFYEPDFFTKINKVEGELLICSMLRGDITPPQADPTRAHPTSPLWAVPEMMAPCAVGIEQIILSGKLLKTVNLAPHPHADGMMISEMVQKHGAKYIPNANVWFNYLEPGRWIKTPELPAGLIEAKNYVGTNEISGQVQVELLRREGCDTDSFVLEIGCGCLHASVPLVQFLQPARYIGVDPNFQLREKALSIPWISKLMEERRVRFLSVNDFDASAFGLSFDFVLSHSILSHCAHWQLDQFLKNTSAVLDANGKILASIRLAEGNQFGSVGRPDKKDSKDQSWVYPGVSWFTMETVKNVSSRYGLQVELNPEHTRFYTQIRPEECHDWLVFTKTP